MSVSDLVQLPDSGYIILGSTTTSLKSHITLTKTDQRGKAILHCKLSSANSIYPGKIIHTQDGNILILGNEGFSSSSISKILLIKTDVYGGILWSNTYGLPAQVENSADVIETSDGSYLLCGTSDINNNDVLLLKVGANGNLISGRTIGTAGGGETAASIQNTKDNGIIIAGSTAYPNERPYIIRLDSLLNIAWANLYVFSTATDGIYTWCVDQADNDFIISGVYNNTIGYFEPYLMRLDSIGSVLWMKKYFSNAMVSETFETKTCKDGGFISVLEPEHFSVSGSQFGLFKTDGNGNVLWNYIYQTKIGGFPNSVIETRDGGFAGIGTNTSSFPNNPIFFVKVDSLGQTGNCPDTSLIFSPVSETPTVSSLGLANNYSGQQPVVITRSFISLTDSIYCEDVPPIPPPDPDTCAISIYIPNAFSPNGDGENDALSIHINDSTCLTEFQIHVYNRWMETVFETNYISNFWQGTYNGEPLNTGVFIYYCKAVFLNGRQELRKGNITLLR